jgi:hypothetical protein
MTCRPDPSSLSQICSSAGLRSYCSDRAKPTCSEQLDPGPPAQSMQSIKCVGVATPVSRQLRQLSSLLMRRRLEAPMMQSPDGPDPLALHILRLAGYFFFILKGLVVNHKTPLARRPGGGAEVQTPNEPRLPEVKDFVPKFNGTNPGLDSTQN